MDHDSCIFVAGHRGLVGSAVLRALRNAGHERLLLRKRTELDLRDPAATDAFFREHQPSHVFMAAARVGGIHANRTRPAEFIEENLRIQNSVISAARRYGVEKFLFLGSSCIYPKVAKQPIREDSLLTGPLEETNQWYAVAKIAGIKLVQAYRQQYGFAGISAMPTNLYGPGDNFDLKTSHVLPALIRKFHEAKVADEPEVVVWGSGNPLREFLHVDDLGDACLHLMRHYDEDDIVNVGSGEEISIKELARLIRNIVGYKGQIVHDTSMPDGMPRKMLNVDRMRSLGWRPRIALTKGIADTYQWYLETNSENRTSTKKRTEVNHVFQSSGKISDLPGILARVAAWRARGMRIGFANGCFDILHPGHVSLCRQAHAACDRLIVGLNSDASVTRLKGPGRPVNNEEARATLLAALSDVDAVVIFDEDTPLALIEAIRPDLLVKGADYTIETVVGADVVQANGGTVLLARLEEGHSTTRTITRLASG